MKDFFVSYSHGDAEIVSEIVDKFKFFQIECWFQLADCTQQFTKAIIEGLKQSSNFVVFLSRNSIESNYVLNEIYMAVEKQKDDKSFHIVPVVIDDVDVKGESFLEVKAMIGRFNFLFMSDYQSIDELVLKILDQAKIERSYSEGVNSIYDCTTDIEKQRIDAQNQFLNRIAGKYLDEVFEKLESPVILDVGCSDGDNIIRRLEGRDYSKLVGIDDNIGALDKAIDNYENDKNSFFDADITDESFESRMNVILKKSRVKGFDLIHISSVLLHTKNPDAILRTLYKFLNEGGYIFIQDEDDGVSMAYPNSEFFDSCFYLYQHSKESGDRHMARKIPVMLHNSGYEDISLKSTAISSIDFGGEERETLWDMYFNPKYWNACEPKYFDSVQSADALRKVLENHDAKKEEYMKGNIFVMLGVFFYVATKKSL